MSDKTIINVDNRVFIVSREDDKVYLTVQVLAQPGITTMLTDEQADQIAAALRQTKRCTARWRAGIVQAPGGEHIPDRSRCVLDKHEGDEHRFRNERGEVVSP